jgi:hypothetical protein
VFDPSKHLTLLPQLACGPLKFGHFETPKAEALVVAQHGPFSG